MSNRRINETIGIRYDDLGKMKLILNDVNTILSKNTLIDQSQKAKVYFKSFSASCIVTFYMCFPTLTKDWEEFLAIKQDILLKTADIIEKHNAEIAYPTSIVYLNKMQSDNSLIILIRSLHFLKNHLLNYSYTSNDNYQTVLTSLEV